MILRLLPSVAFSFLLTLAATNAAYAKNPPFSAKSRQSITIAPYSFLGTQCAPDLAIKTTEIGTLNEVRFPPQPDIDAFITRFSGCRYESLKVMQRQGSYRIFPGLKPYYLDPFTPGDIPPQYAALKPDYTNITIDDAMTEPAMWRLISAYAIFSQIEEHFITQSRRQGDAGIADAPYEKDAFGFQVIKAADPKKIVLTKTDIERARPLATGARIKATRALLWQYQQLKMAPDFSLDHCRRFGAAQLGLGYTTQTAAPDHSPTNASELLAVYNAEFRKLALPKLLASFGKIKDYTELVNEQSGQYSQSVWQAVPNYECVQDATGFVLVATSNTIEVARNAKLDAERIAAENESRRQQQAAQAAIARNAKAASGNFAPVDDDILRAVIDARSNAIAPNVAIGQALIPGDVFSYRYNYETGFYWERLAGVQEVALLHDVRNTTCTRQSALPVVYDCKFDMRLDISASIFGLTSPTIKTPFWNYAETVRFANGRWSIDGLTERYARDRRSRASSVNSFDHGKAAREFHCISENNFASQFGMVRNLDCM